MPLVKDRSLDLLTSSPARSYWATDAPSRYKREKLTSYSSYLSLPPLLTLPTDQINKEIRGKEWTFILLSPSSQISLSLPLPPIRSLHRWLWCGWPCMYRMRCYHTETNSITRGSPYTRPLFPPYAALHDFPRVWPPSLGDGNGMGMQRGREGKGEEGIGRVSMVTVYM